MVVTPSDTLAHRILRWFDANARILPWRNPPGALLPLDDPDWPYRVWLSEIMLQQTVVATVKPYFEAFTTRWPSVTALAAAEDAEVMAAWAGLGYYARARNLLACARAVAAMGGRFPDDEAGLRALPGIGAYTAAAITAFAFGKRAVVVDGNIERITARLFALDTPMPKVRPEIATIVDAMTPADRAGDFAQGLMDMAGMICTPRNPRCLLCPVAEDCQGRAEPELYPVKLVKKAKPEREGVAWWIEQDGKVWLVRRPDKGLLGGMRALPGEEWVESFRRHDSSFRRTPESLFSSPNQKMQGESEIPAFAKMTDEDDSQRISLGTITHIFTHFRLTLHVVTLPPERGCALQPDGEWWPLDRLAEAGLPTVFAKAAARALAREE
jgi:A/G-specific adenine glycosylase